MIKLLEPQLLITCRKEDAKLVKDLIPECEKHFVETMKKEASGDKEYSTKLTLVETSYFTAEQGGDCGGVVLTSLDKRIVCNNTLASRLDLCFEELLPHIRRILFPAKVSEVAAPVETTDGDRKSHAAGGKHHK